MQTQGQGCSVQKVPKVNQRLVQEDGQGEEENRDRSWPKAMVIAPALWDRAQGGSECSGCARGRVAKAQPAKVRSPGG